MTHSRSRRLPQPTSSDPTFDAAFLGADYERCHALLAERPDGVDTALAEAEVYIRERRYLDVVRSLSGLRITRERQALKRDVLLGAAYGYTKDYATGMKRLRRVLDAAAPQSALHLEASYYAALIAWMDSESGNAEAFLRPVLSRGDENLRGRAHILESWIFAKRRDVRRQVQSLEASLQATEAAPMPDQGVRANALFTLALLCRELPLPKQLRAVRAAFSSFPWTSSLRVYRFQIARLLGWTDALAGNELQAFRQFRSAQELAPSAYWQVMCILDRAYLARATGEAAFADDQLREADRQARRLQWSDTSDEERSALLVLAELFAESEPAAAQGYLAQFRSLSTSVSAALAYGSDPRVRGFAQYSAGVALAHLDEHGEAEAALRDAWQIFEDFEYGWRSARAALALYAVTRDERWLTRAEQRIKPWPESWIARKIAAQVQRPSTAEITDAQAEVLALLLEGKKNAEIAKALGRSPHTVRNHLAQIFQKLRVNSRAELFAKLRNAR